MSWHVIKSPKLLLIKLRLENKTWDWVDWNFKEIKCVVSGTSNPI